MMSFEMTTMFKYMIRSVVACHTDDDFNWKVHPGLQEQFFLHPVLAQDGLGCGMRSPPQQVNMKELSRPAHRTEILS
jgi:hypothetical protein